MEGFYGEANELTRTPAAISNAPKEITELGAPSMADRKPHKPEAKINIPNLVSIKRMRQALCGAVPCTDDKEYSRITVTLRYDARYLLGLC